MLFHARLSFLASFLVSPTCLTSEELTPCSRRPLRAVSDAVSFAAGASVRLPNAVLGVDAATGTRTSFVAHKPGVLEFYFRAASLAENQVLFQGVDSANLVDYFTVSLHRGQVMCSLQYGAGPLVITAPGVFADGEWHHVSVSKTVGHASVVVDHGVSTAQGQAADASGSAWQLSFLKTISGALAARNIGPAIRGISVEACARRCLDEPACLSFDYRQEVSEEDPSLCHLGNGVVGVGGGVLSHQFPGFTYHELRTSKHGSGVVVGSDPSGADAFGGCLGGITLNGVPFALNMAAPSQDFVVEGELSPCS